MPPPEVVQQAGTIFSVVCQATSTDPSLEIQWHYINTEGQKIPVKSSSSAVQDLLFKIKTTAFLRTNVLNTAESTLIIEPLSAAYAGGYACTATAGDIKVESGACQVQVQVGMGVRCG